MKKLPVGIRPLKQADLPQVLAIEDACFPSPWSTDDFHLGFKYRWFMRLAMAEGRRIVGYIVATPDPKAQSLMVTNLAVSQSCRRQQVASQLVLGMIGECQRKWPKLQYSALVCETNLEAQLFFRALCFRAEHILPSSDPACDLQRYRFRYAAPFIPANRIGHLFEPNGAE